jgi:hypothetical protein
MSELQEQIEAVKKTQGPLIASIAQHVRAHLEFGSDLGSGLEGMIALGILTAQQDAEERMAAPK